MKEIKWNDNWKFWPDKDAFALVWNVPENAKEVTLPHDAMVDEAAYEGSLNGGNTGFRDGGSYTYVKHIFIPATEKDQTIFLKFEGVYMNTFVYVNGQLAARCPYGYSTFFVPIHSFAKYDTENEIRVLVRNSGMPNSRWYSGSGIYRDVYLLKSGLTYLVPEGVQIRTENADEAYAAIHVSTELKTREYIAKEYILETKIMDATGLVAATDKAVLALAEADERTISQRILIENPKLWSEETPVCYTCITSLYEKMDGEEVLVDQSEERFGIRTLALDAKRGLRVNGRMVKLRGACIHHDSGLLGAATYYDAQYRQIRKLKEAGFNAVRMSHHPMAPAMLRACDELGVYVMDEAFDMWTRCKSEHDYGQFFGEWWEQDVTAMVRKDFNHPSVIMYSIGNEIPEIGTCAGSALAGQIQDKIKSIDDTRYTLAAINGVFASGDAIDRIVADIVAGMSEEEASAGNVNNFMTLMDSHMDKIVVHNAITERLERACATTDIAGYNYMRARYEMDGARYPNRVIVGSETYPPEIAKNWADVKNMSYVIGDFTWTGWDYIGEAGVGIPAYKWGDGGFGAHFPAQLAYVGDIDITGNRRPVSYFREIVFGLRKEPYIAVQNPNHYGEHLIKTPWVLSDSQSSWTWNGFEGKPVVVEVYAPGEEVELFVNGKSLGREVAGEAAGYRVIYETIYEPGEIVAVSYEDAMEIGRHIIHTTAEAECLNVITETVGSTLVYLDVYASDKLGNVVTNAEQKLSVEVSGAQLQGFGSANPKTSYGYKGTETETFRGHAQVILRKKENASISVKITADSGLVAETTIHDIFKEN